MFRGEPLALWTIVNGFFYYLVAQLFGLIIADVIPSNVFLATQSHFFLVHFGWIGFVILGSQLQFFRALTGLRKYEPRWLRWLFLISLNFGMILIVLGSSIANQILIQVGLLIYLLGAFIQFFWINKTRSSKYFRFPLDYFFVSQIAFIVTIAMIFLTSIQTFRIISEISILKHVLAIVWISLTLQGAMIRILPMFLGQGLDRSVRSMLDAHIKFSIVTAFLFILSLIVGNRILIIIASVFWGLNWLWTFFIAFKSIIKNRSSLIHPITALFFVSGIIWSIIGGVYGILALFSDGTPGLRGVHIHISLFGGLALIMLGAIHRIHTFQVYTILFTGKSKEKKMESLYHVKTSILVVVALNLSIIFMMRGFLIYDFTFIGYAGLGYLSSNLLYSSILFRNLRLYFSLKSKAIPFWLKSSEYHE